MKVDLKYCTLAFSACLALAASPAAAFDLDGIKSGMTRVAPLAGAWIETRSR